MLITVNLDLECPVLLTLVKSFGGPQWQCRSRGYTVVSVIEPFYANSLGNILFLCLCHIVGDGLYSSVITTRSAPLLQWLCHLFVCCHSSVSPYTHCTASSVGLILNPVLSLSLLDSLWHTCIVQWTTSVQSYYRCAGK